MNNIIKRKLVPGIKKFLDDREIIVVHGSRQVGKTSLLLYLIDNHIKEISSDTNIFYFDLEDFQLLELCNSSPEDVISYLKSKGADIKSRIYLLIDEIQYLKNPSSFLKLFHDRHGSKVKLIVSGSSSMLIKKKFKDSLVGRIVDFELFTLDFEEFLDFKGERYNLRTKMTNVVQNEMRKLYSEFMIYGGYPAIVLEDDEEKKEIKLKQIINAYIRKDIRDIADIRNIDSFNSLVRVLATQAGKMLNVLELSNALGIAKQTVNEYLFLLENTYIVRRVRPFHRNMRSELTKMPKIYFEDTGLMNILMNKTFSRNTGGAILENSVYSELRKNIPVENIFFWRTNKQQEVDFIVEDVKKGGRKALKAIEVKNSFLNKHTRHLVCFKKQYKETEAFFYCMKRNERNRNDDITVIHPWNKKE